MPPETIGRPHLERGRAKTAPQKLPPSTGILPRKPPWIRAKAPTDPKVLKLKALLREKRLHTVCEEAACPNLGECFSHGAATFMILGDLCTRRCPFCDVAHGRPAPPDPEEPGHLAEAVAGMGLSYAVITSVDAARSSRARLRDADRHQYLQPSRYHLPVERFVTPAEFRELGDYAQGLGFSRVASGPLVRSSYHADLQARGEPVE